MASKKETTKKPEAVLTDADNPSLIQAGQEIHLRVLDDFFIEKELPKWKRFHKDWEDLTKSLQLSFKSVDDARRAIDKLEDPKLQEEYRKRLASYRKGQKKIDDDRYDIKGKHERDVESSLTKTVRLMREPTWKDRFLTKLHLKPAKMSVELAFEDLKAHLLHTTTEEMAKKRAVVLAVEKKFRDLGQYNKADQVKAYADQIVEEDALVAAGFDTFVTEEMMIDFIRKSERGVMVDFLRYYEGVIPDEVAEKKKKADEAMIFDNYVVAYYADLKKKAKQVVAATKAKEAKKEVARRRDPILFGVIKESRKLVYIADWVTDTDDLTLQVLEEALSLKAPKLSETAANLPADSGERIVRDSLAQPSSSSTFSYYDSRDADAMTRRWIVQTLRNSDDGMDF